jgi:CHAT domain-containing protein
MAPNHTKIVAAIIFVLALIAAMVIFIGDRDPLVPSFTSHILPRGGLNTHLVDGSEGAVRVVVIPANDPLEISLTGAFRVGGTQHERLRFVSDQEYGGLLYLHLEPIGSVSLEVTSRDPSIREETSYRLAIEEVVDPESIHRDVASSYEDNATFEELRQTGEAWLRDGRFYLGLHDLFTAGIKQQLTHSKFAEAESFYRNAIEVAEALNEVTVIAWLKRWIATTQNARGDRTLGRESLCDGLARLQGHPNCEFEFESIPESGLRVAAVIANELGLTAHSGENLDEAERWYQATIAFLDEAYPWQHQRAITTNNLGGVFFYRGRYREARDRFETAYDTHVALNNAAAQINNLSNIGLAEEKLGNLNAALTRFNSAVDLAKTRNARVDEAFVLRRLGRLNRNIGRLPVALSQAERALVVMQDAGDVPGTIDVQLLLGDIHLESNESSEATLAYETALATALDIGDVGSMVHAYQQLARVATVLGDMRVANDFIQKAYIAATEEGLAVELPTILETMGIVAEANGEEAAAKVNYEASRSLSIEVPSQYISSTVRLARMVRTEPEDALDILADADPYVTQWLESTSDPFVEAEVTQRISALVEEKIHAQLQLALESTNPSSHINEALRLTDQMRSRVLDRLRTRTGPASGLRSSKIDIETGHRIAIFEVADSQSYLWFVTPTDTRFFSLPGRVQLNELVDRVVSEFRSRLPPSEAQLTLSQALFSSVADELDGNVLYVIADESLNAIPFAALPHPNHPKRPLVVETTVINIPNLGWIRDGAGSDVDIGSVLAIGDPVHGGGSVSNTGSSLEALPGTRLELENVASHFAASPGLELSTRFEATRAAFLNLSHDSYDLFHFALHGVVDRRFPELSGLYLSTTDNQGNPINGFLSATEIAQLNLNAQLVVLSACDTAVGRTLSGEGTLSLAWSFLAAGSSRVISSLWQVSDRSTAELMSMFYQFLVEDGLSPAKALRQAQLSMYRTRRTRNPYHWAGFVLIGA